MNPIEIALQAFGAFAGVAPAMLDAFKAAHPKLVNPPPESGESEANAAGTAALEAKFPASADVYPPDTP